MNNSNSGYVLLKKEHQEKSQALQDPSLTEVPIEERRNDAEKPLFLKRYE